MSGVTAQVPVVCMQCYFSQEGLKPLNPEGASAEGSFTNIAMSGQDVFRFAVRAVPAVSSLPLLSAWLHLYNTAATGCWWFFFLNLFDLLGSFDDAQSVQIILRSNAQVSVTLIECSI